MPSFTTQTNLSAADTKFIEFLEVMAAKFGVVERTTFAAINQGQKVDAAFENKLQQTYGFSSQYVRNAITKAEGNYKSQKELIGDYVKQAKDAITAIKATIKKLQKKVAILQKQSQKNPDKLKGIPNLEFKIHQKKRKLAQKEARLKAGSSGFCGLLQLAVWWQGWEASQSRWEWEYQMLLAIRVSVYQCLVLQFMKRCSQILLPFVAMSSSVQRNIQKSFHPR